MITNELGRACRHAKREFLRDAVTKRDWAGIRQLKRFRAQQARIMDSGGRILTAGQRAQVMANFFRDEVWGPIALHELPDRPARYPIADMTTNAFTAEELRVAGRSLTPNKIGGTDDVENEFLRLMLSTGIGFTLLLSLFCRCWDTKSMPTAFDLARIVAVYKANGKDTSDPENYLPIALLQTCYKLYSTLLLNRLKKCVGDRVHKYQYGFQKKYQQIMLSFRFCVRWS